MPDAMPPLYLNKEWFWRIDELFHTADPQIYQAVLNRLQNESSIVDVARLAIPGGDTPDLELPITEDDVAHFGDDWVGTWWKDELVDEIFRAGLIVAVSTAMELELPLETMWIHGGARFQVYVVEGQNQVTAVIFSPRAPANNGWDSGDASHLPVHLVRERGAHDGDLDDVGDIEGVGVQHYGTRGGSS